MFRMSLMTIPAMAAMAFVTGCSTLEAIDTSAISTIQQLSVSACGFLPLVETVNAILVASKKGNLGQTNIDLATAVCKSVTMPSTGGTGKAVPTIIKPIVNGIIVQGEFVR